MAVAWFSFQTDFRPRFLEGLAAALTSGSAIAPGTGTGWAGE